MRPQRRVCLWPAAERAGDNCRRDCFGRLVPGATVHRGHFGRVLEADLGRDVGALDQLAEASDCERCTLSETKVKADLASRFSVPAPANSLSGC